MLFFILPFFFSTKQKYFSSLCFPTPPTKHKCYKLKFFLRNGLHGNGKRVFTLHSTKWGSGLITQVTLTTWTENPRSPQSGLKVLGFTLTWIGPYINCKIITCVTTSKLNKEPLFRFGVFQAFELQLYSLVLLIIIMCSHHSRWPSSLPMVLLYFY